MFEESEVADDEGAAGKASDGGGHMIAGLFIFIVIVGLLTSLSLRT